MNIEEYFEKINYALDTMSDEEFDDLLIKSGIENCPFVENDEDYTFTLTAKPTKKNYYLYKNTEQNNFSELIKVA